MRYFNEQPLELLAPAGTFDIFQGINTTSCDAIYFGGKVLNMRMIRKGYNFSNDEIKEAIYRAHEKDKKVYITVNNLMDEGDISAAKSYLLFLQDVKPDALIVQDFAVLSLIKDLNLQLPLHSSVMMNVHNLPMIEQLEALGIKRVVLSRELDLQTIAWLHAKTSMELEYFTHGDMCVCHGAQCLYSGLLFGMSSNRGRCLKPCRWGYKLRYEDKQYPTKYPLAVKDLSMYEHLPEMIQAGIRSFKIEGRMRERDFIFNLVNLYGEALDRYIEDPLMYPSYLKKDVLETHRKRDFSVGYAFGKPGLDDINERNEGTGKMYSSGKMFSTPTEEPALSSARLQVLEKTLKPSTKTSPHTGQLAVKVQDMAQAQAALEEEVDILYLSGDIYAPRQPFSIEAIKSLVTNKGKSQIYLAFPRMMDARHFSHYDHLFKQHALDLDGLLVTNLGALYRYKSLGYSLLGDVSLNIYNGLAADFYGSLGLDGYTLSLEAPSHVFTETLEHSSLSSEVIVQGHPAVMYLEHDLYENTQVLTAEATTYPYTPHLLLKTGKGEQPVLKDQYGRNHVFTAKELCLLPLMSTLNTTSLQRFRIEASFYDGETLRERIKWYQHALNETATHAKHCDNILQHSHLYTLGALNFD